MGNHTFCVGGEDLGAWRREFRVIQSRGYGGDLRPAWGPPLMISRLTALSLAGGLAFACSVAACASFEQTPRACYWLSNINNQWEVMPSAETRTRCYELDSCSGGLGQSGGGCYKWTTSPSAPQNTW